MDTFKIIVKKYDSSPDYFVYTNRGKGKEYLFRFYKNVADGNIWYFDIPENGHSHFIMSEQVPVEYILAFSKSVINVRYCLIDFEVEFTAETQKRLKSIK